MQEKNFLLTEQQVQFLQQESEAKEITESELIRRILDKELSHEKQTLEEHLLYEIQKQNMYREKELDMKKQAITLRQHESVNHQYIYQLYQELIETLKKVTDESTSDILLKLLNIIFKHNQNSS